MEFQNRDRILNAMQYERGILNFIGYSILSYYFSSKLRLNLLVKKGLITRFWGNFHNRKRMNLFVKYTLLKGKKEYNRKNRFNLFENLL
ncbi:hypothetical protein ACFL96_12350 [Thermoproteota archaeon]